MEALPETRGEQARLLADIGGTNARFAWQSHSGGNGTYFGSHA